MATASLPVTSRVLLRARLQRPAKGRIPAEDYTLQVEHPALGRRPQVIAIRDNGRVSATLPKGEYDDMATALAVLSRIAERKVAEGFRMVEDPVFLQSKGVSMDSAPETVQELPSGGGITIAGRAIRFADE